MLAHGLFIYFSCYNQTDTSAFVENKKVILANETNLNNKIDTTYFPPSFTKEIWEENCGGKKVGFEKYSTESYLVYRDSMDNKISTMLFREFEVKLIVDSVEYLVNKEMFLKDLDSVAAKNSYLSAIKLMHCNKSTIEISVLFCEIPESDQCMSFQRMILLKGNSRNSGMK